MESSWETHYSLEASNYLLDNGQLVAPLFFAMEALDDTLSPGEYEFKPGVQMAIIEEHIVTFTRDFEQKIIDVQLIIPLN